MPASSSSTAALATTPDPLALVTMLVKALDDKKAGDLRVLSVGEHSSITDYLILASGQANPHLRALRIQLERVLDDANAPIAGVESGEDSGWVVFDAYQVMIHLFMPEQREVYQLEQLWRDAEELDVAVLLAPPEPKPKQKKTATKTVGTKKTPVKKTAVTKKPVKKVVAEKVSVRK
ncbi:MAG: ribosome silencing factor [Candidatus Synoicihabitans palmerolidicus]|nr:ribosome silencing factor [Candidatus Synoicihabitans palmerolidicus]